jgi:hypothetical protein
MNDERLDTILVDALAALESGETVEQILGRYPAEADQLRPMLRAAVRLTSHGQAVRRAAPSAQARSRAAFLARAAGYRPRPAPAVFLTRLVSSRVALSFLTVLVVVAAIGGTVIGASAASLPGDPLYGVKRSVENVQLSLTFDPARRVSLEESYGQRRTEEVKAVQAVKRSVPVEFAGAVQVISATEWTIGGLTVQVNTDTVIDGNPQVNDLVEVTGHTLPDGGIVAERIESEGVDLTGIVEAMDSHVWSIGGQQVLVTRETRITGTARLGARVEAHARRFADGTLFALKIEFDDHDLPIPTPRVVPSVTPQPAMTVRPTETQRARPTDADRPDQTPAPSRTPEPTRTPRPTGTEDSGRTPEPKETPKPTVGVTHAPSRTPEPTETHEPGRTPEPTHVPEATKPPEPTRPPEPTKSPEPTHSPEPTEAHLPTLTPKP